MSAVAGGAGLEAAGAVFPLLTAEVTLAVEIKVVVVDSSSLFTFSTSLLASGPTVQSMDMSASGFSLSSSMVASREAVALIPAVTGSDVVNPLGPLVCRVGCDPLSKGSEGREGWVSHFAAGCSAWT